jgi:hypothetical protein
MSFKKIPTEKLIQHLEEITKKKVVLKEYFYQDDQEEQEYETLTGEKEVRSSNDKYELLTSDSINWKGKTLYRIRSLKKGGYSWDFEVKEGTLGGYIESEKNLSLTGNAWVGGNCKVYGSAIVKDNAMIFQKVEAFDNAIIEGNAIVSGDVIVFENAIIGGEANVWGDAFKVHGSAKIIDNARVWGDKHLEIGGSTIVRKTGTIRKGVHLGDEVIDRNTSMYGESLFRNFMKKVLKEFK